MLIPLLLSMIVASIIIGILVTVFGYYVPAMITSSIFMSIGTGLLITLQTATSPSKWIGYQVLFGAGIGMGMQQPLLCAQTVLKLQDIPVGTSLLVLMQSLGGCIFLAVTENVFCYCPSRRRRQLPCETSISSSIPSHARSQPLHSRPATPDARYKKACDVRPLRALDSACVRSCSVAS